MILFIKKEKEFRYQMSIIKKTIDKINLLATDGFKIILTDNQFESNSVLYLCSRENIADYNPDFDLILNEGVNNEISGFAYSEFSTDSYIIDMSLIFINSEKSIDIQESMILEEITQSLGLGNDSNKYPNSIFYQKKYELESPIKKHSLLDIDIIKLLYHPKMKPGFDSIQVEKTITKILQSEKLNFINDF